MRISDLVFAFPPIILAMAVVAALGPGLRNAVLAIVVVAWPSYARVVRSLVITFRGREFVAASRLLGSSNRRALAVEMMPNVYGPVLVLATLELGNAILLLAGLSFLGLGARPPSPEWGAMVAEGARTFDRWWIAMFPGLAILTVVIAFNFLGDSLRDALDPRTSRALGTRGPVTCWRSRTCASCCGGANVRSPSSTACRWRSRPARWSASPASRAAARR